MTRHDGTRRKLDRLVAELGLLRHGTPQVEPVTENRLDALPEPAQRWLRRAGVVGHPPVTNFRVRFDGRIRMKPGQGWMPLVAWQLNTVDPIARIFQMRVDAAHVVPMFGTDSYVSGTGEMRGRLLGLVTVAEGRGEEFDLGELVTWLNDAVMLAPSMLLRPSVTWAEDDDRSFSVAVADGEHQVTARVVLGDDDLPVDFVTDDRWYAGTDPPTRTRWRTPLEDWTATGDGLPVPGHGAAVWCFDDGEFTYIEGTFDRSTLALDVT